MSNGFEHIGLTVAAQTALDAMMPVLEPLNLFSTKLSADGLAKGKSVEVRLYNVPGDAGDFDISSNNYQDSVDLDLDKVTVTLDQHKKQTFELTDEDQGKLASGEPDKLIALQAQSVAKAALLEIYEQITISNFSTAVLTGAASTLDTDDFADFLAAAKAANMNMDSLGCMLEYTYMQNLRKDDAIKHYLNANTDQVLREGYVGRLSGFNTYESTIIPDNSENLKGFITDGTALAVATAVVNPGIGSEMVIDHAVATDPTGFSVGVRKHYDPETGKTYMTVEILMGVSVGRAAGLQRIMSQAVST